MQIDTGSKGNAERDYEMDDGTEQEPLAGPFSTLRHSKGFLAGLLCPEISLDQDKQFSPETMKTDRNTIKPFAKNVENLLKLEESLLDIVPRTADGGFLTPPIPRDRYNSVFMTAPNTPTGNEMSFMSPSTKKNHAEKPSQFANEKINPKTKASTFAKGQKKDTAKA